MKITLYLNSLAEYQAVAQAIKDACDKCNTETLRRLSRRLEVEYQGHEADRAAHVKAFGEDKSLLEVYR